ncbi:hypothetical protein [Hymenobacter koreensis]|uniref:Uncharacterized protein n=1 Tax=Hymenobacter koreensis TaxID=1084523 RepID=A0ABP8IX61_9BACT
MIKQKTTRRQVLAWAILVAIVFFFLWVGWGISPGSYSRAEGYSFAFGRPCLIEQLTALRSREGLQPPSHFFRNEGSNPENSHFYTLYLQIDGYLYHCVLRGGKTTSELLFSGVLSSAQAADSAGFVQWDWRQINEDQSTESFKKTLEQRVLAQLDISACQPLPSR